MTTVSSTFTATGTSTALRISGGETMALALSGTWVGTVILQRKAGSAWETYASYSANESRSITARDGGDTFRWKCTVFTSGTVVYSLADGATDALTIQSADGDPITLTVSGTTNVTLPTTGTLATIAGTETLTNKTLTAPVLNNATVGVETTLTATASGIQATALALTATKDVHHITVCATNGDAVKLPVLVVGERHFIHNSGAATCQVFGAGTSTINDVATATGVTLTNGKGAWFVAVATGKWYTAGLA